MPSWSRLSRLALAPPRLTPPMAPYTMSHQQQPPWLESLLEDRSPPPKLFAWTPANLSPDDTTTTTTTTAHHPQQDDLARRIFVLGVGNIGRLYASHLARHPDPPPITLVVHREALLRAWAAGAGLELTRAGVTTRTKAAFDVEFWTDRAPDRGPVREVAGGGAVRNLLVATKAAAAMPAVDRLRGYLDARSAVAFAQNGMAKLWPPHGASYVARRYPGAGADAPSFLACVTGHGVFSLGPFRSVHASPADACIGPVLLGGGGGSESVDYLTRQVAAAPGLAARAVSSRELWLLQLEKLVVNASINPLTAVLRCQNGGLFDGGDDGPVARVMDRMLGETSAVLRALVAHESSAQVLLADGDAAGLDAAREQLRARFEQPRLRAMLHAFGARVGANTSSMLQDVQAGRPTEVRDFNGWLVDTAAFLDQGLDVSTHRALVDLVESGTVLSKEQLGERLLV